MQIRLVGIVLSASLLAGGTLRAQAQTSATATAGRRIALLIGIDTYNHPGVEIKAPADAPKTGRFQLPLTYPDLKGPSHDVAAMHALLADQKFGFSEANIHALLNADATRQGILDLVQKYLVTDSKPGDTVVLYVSSHGSLRSNPDSKSKSEKFDLDGSGNPVHVEGTIVPYDWYQGKDDVFGRELRHMYNQAAGKGVNLTVILDSCHSGATTRGPEDPNARLVARAFLYDPRPMPADPYPDEELEQNLPQNRPAGKNPVLILAAAQPDQSAIDVQSGEAHGLFTSALVETLYALPKDRPASDIFKRLQVSMENAPGASNQQPVLEASSSRAAQPLFGGEAGAGPATTAVVSVDADGKEAILDIGPIADIGSGSEFEPITPGRAPVKVTVTAATSINRSHAAVTPPNSVKAGDILQLAKAMPADRPKLLVYAGASNPPIAEIQQAFTTLRAAGVTLVDDPTLKPWTEHIAWNGSRWTLSAHSKKAPGGQIVFANPVLLSARFSASDVKKIPAGSLVWFDPPLPAESLAGLLPAAAPGDKPSSAVVTPDRTQATYIVAGSASSEGPLYTWMKRSDADNEVQSTAASNFACSPHSAFPMRTDWFPYDKAAPPEASLNDAAQKLAALNSWLHLDSTGLANQADYPYHLIFERTTGHKALGPNELVTQGSYQLVLARTSSRPAEKRWVYVLGINCQGKSVLLWPEDTIPATKLPPDDAGSHERMPLGDPFDVGPPYGSDTYLLITTATPILEPHKLEFEAVALRGAKAAEAPPDPLTDLLENMSAGTRSPGRPLPSKWSVQAVQTQSDAAAAPTNP